MNKTANPRRVTSGGHNDSLMYFTSNSLLADDSRLVFIRYADGRHNLFMLDMASGRESQITYFPDIAPNASLIHGVRKNDFNVIHESSVVLYPQTGMLYFVRGRDICRYDLKGNGRVLAALPPGRCTSCAHVSEDGAKFLISSVDGRCFDRYDGSDSKVIDEDVQRKKLDSYLHVFDTDTGEELLRETIRSAWVTHVQFNPMNDDEILYNHEWPSDCGVRRMWLFDGKRHIRLRTEGEGRSRDDWTCHEMWERGTGNLIYHGTYKNNVSYIGRIAFCNPNDRYDYTITEIPMPESYVKYGHFTVSNTNLLVTDGYYQEDGEEPGGCGKWITVLKPDWDNETIEWHPLCRHGSNWDCQESHPHPVFSHAADSVYFNSNRDGLRAVYKMDVNI